METETEATPVVPVAVVEEPRRIKPGWYILGALFLYALLSTFLWLRPKETVMGQGSTPEVATLAPDGLWFPIPGAKIPQEDRFLPTADRPYRKGINQGFVFNTDGTGIPINYGTPVIAAGDGTIMRADLEYQEMSSSEWRQLLDTVSVSGADDQQLDKLRGRQIWIRLEDGSLLRYGHLSNIKQGIDKGVQVYRGQVIGYVGNSGTDDGVSKTTGGARLQFEVWPIETSFFGQSIETMEQVRSAASGLFVGP